MTLREKLEKSERYWRHEKYEFPTFSPMYEQCHGREMMSKSLLETLPSTLLDMEVEQCG